MANQWAGVVLAAGKGTRMRSSLPKVLHPVAGKAMVLHVIDAVEQAGVEQRYAVVGKESGAIRDRIGSRAVCVEQTDAFGTGHAVLQARVALNDKADHVLVLYGDTPLVQAETLRQVMAHHLSTEAAATIVTAQRDNARGLGRVLRSDFGSILAIVEEAEASEEERAISETNEGVYCFERDWLWDQLQRLPKRRNNEYYLTDLIGLASAAGYVVESMQMGDSSETMGINDRVQLAVAEAAMRQRIRERLMLGGVTMLDPATTYIDAEVVIGQDTIIHPQTTLSGATVIGSGCDIGPGCIIRDTKIADRCRIISSMIEESTIEQGVTIGPFSHLRPGAYIEADVHLGNYVEVKNSRIGRHTQVGHFSYIGDATLGQNVNIGAGTITCNYDGVSKHQTHIGDRAFIGSDTMLVAPVSVGDDAATGAGTVVTKDIPPGRLAVGTPARLVPQYKAKKENGP